MQTLLNDRMHAERLDGVRARASQAHDDAVRAVREGERELAQARRAIVQNDLRLESLEARRGELRAAVARDAEDRDEEEREDVFAGRRP